MLVNFFIVWGKGEDNCQPHHLPLPYSQAIEYFYTQELEGKKSFVHCTITGHWQLKKSANVIRAFSNIRKLQNKVFFNHANSVFQNKRQICKRVASLKNIKFIEKIENYAPGSKIVVYPSVWHHQIFDPFLADFFWPSLQNFIDYNYI